MSSPQPQPDAAQLRHYLEVAITAADAAGALVKRRHSSSEDKHVKEKSAVDLVTEVDVAAEKAIITILKEAFPRHSFLGEESGGSAEENRLSDGPTWIIDPIDGTTNFVHMYPFVAVCIGLAINQKPVVGVVYNPIMEEKYTAYLGGGAFLNGRPIHVSSANEIGQALISTNVGYGRSPPVIDFMLGNVRTLLEHKVRGLRMTGSAATLMCDVACGRLDSYFEWGVHSWDVAAGSIIVEEAGGVCISPTQTSRVTDPLNLTARSVLCGPKEIVATLFPLLNKGWSPAWK